PAGDQFQIVFVRIWLALGNAPRGAAVVIAGGMNEEDFQTIGSLAVEEGAGGLLHWREKSRNEEANSRSLQEEGPRDRQEGTCDTLDPSAKDPLGDPRNLWYAGKGDTAGGQPAV